ncbi:uncharacterized protein Z519_09707 [Cladophialophora bantiana CBS 173.52]|uniref:Aminodeoxychorismate lyase n=1 Tax=Cladophialophora bantiana (strain ATCC 10958 / CBS 173.52 / CDC B-1940 / NIH 8579) TaxID=1442370 RepID=A0A0D2EHN6_CLAB1|nr:uncharacterized protein Z519_09707 [Cladophialophora bantiana CBS 173.52]KIW89551.1 hypothetical protein Z519_09707 [Cladophialophora bantiana CBS 173.52]
MSSHPVEEDIDSTVADPDFRIVTTLKHTLFNARDVKSQEEPASYRALIRQWREVNRELLALHARRLREAADAFGWADVAVRFSSPAAAGEREGNGDGEGDDALIPSGAEGPINLEFLVEDAAAKSQGDSSSQGPGVGFLRDLRVRVLISRDGDVTVQCTPMGADQPLSTLARSLDMYTSCPFTGPAVLGQKEQQRQSAAVSPLCEVSVDAQHTHVSVFTRHKTTHRKPYDDARARVPAPPLLPTTPPTAREVLLSNSNAQITEASLSTVYFPRGGGRWLTPRSACGGMQSVTRLYALAAGWCDEGTVLVHEVRDGEMIWLSNAVRGFFPGVVKLGGQGARGST